MMKFCKDCRWFYKQDGVARDPHNYSKCMQPILHRLGNVSPVTGELTPPILPYADATPAENGACGPDAKLFEELI